MCDAVIRQEVLMLWQEDVRARGAEDIQLLRLHDLLHGEHLREAVSQVVLNPQVLALDCVLRTPTRFTETLKTKCSPTRA